MKKSANQLHNQNAAYAADVKSWSENVKESIKTAFANMPAEVEKIARAKNILPHIRKVAEGKVIKNYVHDFFSDQWKISGESAEFIQLFKGNYDSINAITTKKIKIHIPIGLFLDKTNEIGILSAGKIISDLKLNSVDTFKIINPLYDKFQSGENFDTRFACQTPITVYFKQEASAQDIANDILIIEKRLQELEPYFNFDSNYVAESDEKISPHCTITIDAGEYHYERYISGTTPEGIAQRKNLIEKSGEIKQIKEFLSPSHSSENINKQLNNNWQNNNNSNNIIESVSNVSIFKNNNNQTEKDLLISSLHAIPGYDGINYESVAQKNKSTFKVKIQLNGGKLSDKLSDIKKNLLTNKDINDNYTVKYTPSKKPLSSYFYLEFELKAPENKFGFDK